jgi:release factor glutamine methyltransferase
MPNSREWSLLEILNETTDFFLKSGIEEYRLHAELLLADVLGLNRLDLYLQFDRLITKSEVDLYREYVRKRVGGMPVQYVLGKTSFRYLDLVVTPDVLIPRHDTEILVDVALDYVGKLGVPKCLDLCCGSGAIALSIAYECKQAFIVGSDVSDSALKIAVRNSYLNQLNKRVYWVCSDLYDGLNFYDFDIITCNPPYIPSKEIQSLQPEIREYEPFLALDGGEDGLDYFRYILKEVTRYLAIGGSLILEVGDNQADTVTKLVGRSGYFESLSTVKDLKDRPRIIIGNKKLG